MWEGKKFPLEKVDWKIFEKNNVTIALNILYTKNEKIYPTYFSKHNSNLENQVIFLNNSKQRSMSLACSKNISSISIIKTSNVYCLNCLHSFPPEKKRESHKRLCGKERFL